MQVNRHKGRVYGGSMTAAEKKAAELEIRKQLAEYDLNNATEMDALVLYILHTEFGFGEKRFKQFFDAMISVNRWLNENQREGDTEYATEKLRERAQKISGMKLDSLDDIV